MKTSKRIRIVYELASGRRQYASCDLAVCFDVARAIARRINDQVFLYGSSGNAVVLPDGRGTYAFDADGAGKITHELDVNTYPCI